MKREENKCNNCGGRLEILTDGTWNCNYCGSIYQPSSTQHYPASDTKEHEISDDVDNDEPTQPLDTNEAIDNYYNVNALYRKEPGKTTLFFGIYKKCVIPFFLIWFGLYFF